MSFDDLNVKNKLQNLVSFLRALNTGFEQIAEEVDNLNLKTAIKAMAMESSQYAKEIVNQFKKLNTTIASEHKDFLWEEVETNVNEHAAYAHGGEILEFCNNAESYIKKLYDEVLQESFLYTKLKSVITYQLYAAECAFMKIRLLNELRFNN